MSLLIAGIDPGLTCTGVTIIDRFKEVQRAYVCKQKPDLPDSEVIEELAIRIVGNMPDPAQLEDGIVVGIEEPIVGKNAGGAIKQAALYGALRIALLRYPDKMLVLVPNKRAKKRLTRNGNADKDMMVAAATEYFEDDWLALPQYVREAQADALAVALVALDRYERV